MKKIIKSLLQFMLFLSIASCSNQSATPPTDFQFYGISPEELNTRVRVTAPSGLGNTYRNNSRLSLVVEVITDDQIAFSKDYDARIYIYDHNKWIEIKNVMEYAEELEKGEILSPIKSDPFNSGVISLAPFYPDIKQKLPMKIIISGHIYKDGQITSQITGGFINLTLNP
jgi:hypothetical protein